MKEKYICGIVGPTAVGKTETGIFLAQILNGEIVSADSMQIYKFMNIGTAKPSPEERKIVPHHMIDIVEPWENYSVAEYQKDALNVIDDIFIRERIPILIGGTGLYVKSITGNLSFTEINNDLDFRNRLQLEASEKGSKFLHDRLCSVDPQSGSRIHPNDLRRIIRALEVYHITGEKLSKLQSESLNRKRPFQQYIVGLTMDRQELYKRIERRVDLMIENGLVDEVKSLVSMGVPPTATAMQGLGYKEIYKYLNGEWDLETAIEIIKRDSRRFAKRQLTWFRRDKSIHWYDVDNFITLQELAKQIKRDLQEYF